MLDQRLIFSDGQSAAWDNDSDNASTNVIDLEGGSLFQSVDNQVGEGEPIYLVVRVKTAITGAGGSSTVNVALQESDDDSTYYDTEIKVLALEEADMTAGATLIRAAVPLGARMRYLRVLYTVNDTEATTAGAVDAYLQIR